MYSHASWKKYVQQCASSVMENLFLQAIGEIRSDREGILAARDYDFYRRNLNCESRDPGADPRRVNKTS